MPNTEQAVAGTKLFIGTIADPPVYTEIESVSNIGALGTSFSKIAVESVGSGYTRQIKGTESHPEFPLVMNRISGAPGQAAVIAASADRNSLYPFKLVENDAPAASTAVVTVTIAAPGVFTDTAHGLSANAPVKFSTTGALPTGLTAGTTYYVKSPTTDAYSVSSTPGGSAITTTGTQSGVHTRSTVPAGTTATFNGRVYGSPVSYGAVNDLKKINTSIEVEPDSLVYTAAA
jgi:predicted Zn-dependent protease